MMNEEVRRIMTKDPMVVSPSQSIDEISNIMVTNRLQQLPVVEDGTFIGLITTYDLWKHTNNKVDTKEMTVKDVMNTNVLKITPKDKVGTAAELFMDKRFKTLPVVNLKNELKGVVTTFDVLRYTLKKEYKTPILYADVIKG